MTFTNLEKYLYSTPPPPTGPTPPSLQQSGRYFRADKVTWLRSLFAIKYAYPADG